MHISSNNVSSSDRYHDTSNDECIPIESLSSLPCSPPISPDTLTASLAPHLHSSPPESTLTTTPDRPRLGTAPASWERRLSQRQKQLDYGFNTIGYQNYIRQIPKQQRKRGDPQTPDKNQRCSTRSWMGQMKRWRRKLHYWDNPTAGNFLDSRSVSERSTSDSTSGESYSSVDSYKAFMAASEWLEELSDSEPSHSDGSKKSPGPSWTDDDIYRFSSLAHYEEEHSGPLT